MSSGRFDKSGASKEDESSGIVIQFPGTKAGPSIAAAIDDPRDASTPTYPFLIIRIFAAFYQRERIRIRIGPPAVEFVNRRCFVQHPAPFSADGTLNPACRELLVLGVQAAVRRLRFRMCVVWAESSCSYVETDRINESREPPSGGSVRGSAPVELEFKPQRYEPAEPSHDAPAPGSS